jgi:hypothetical protein
MLALQHACRENGIGLNWFLGSGDALITRARASLVTCFLDLPEAEATHLLFIDADISFDPKQVLRLIEFGADVSAGCYPVKNIEWNKMGRTLLEKRPPSAGLTYVLGLEDPARPLIRDGFAKVRRVGNGFLMISRTALERLCEANPHLRYKNVGLEGDPQRDSPNRFALFECMIDPETGTYLSEDFAFCQRWTDLGGEIWLDLESQLTHVGPMRFVGDVSTQFGRSATRTTG